jgi:hypothetical protein
MLRYMKKLLEAKRARRKNRCAAEQKRQELRILREEIGACRRQMRVLEGWYDLAADPHTVDSCIFQMCALQVRYEGLLRRARQYAAAQEAGAARPSACIQYGKAAGAAELSARIPQ